MLNIAADELSPAAECALAHRLIADGENPNDWTVSYLWASDDVFGVVLRRGEVVRAFTAFPEDGGYGVVEVTEE